MANAINFRDKKISIGDTLTIDYKIKEGENKERIQQFAGILIKINGMDDATRMITVRKMSKSGVGVERIIPLSSPFISDITIQKESNFSKAKLYFVRKLSNKNLRRKLYKQQ